MKQRATKPFTDLLQAKHRERIADAGRRRWPRRPAGRAADVEPRLDACFFILRTSSASAALLAAGFDISLHRHVPDFLGILADRAIEENQPIARDVADRLRVPVRAVAPDRVDLALRVGIGVEIGARP